MGQFYDSIPDHIISWIPEQHFFFVATAPLAPSGHVNVSPKCMRGTFHIVNPNKVWYEDLTGSGSETIAHLRENGRMTIMFVAMSGPPRILRLFGKGTVHEIGTPEYHEFIAPGTRAPGSRAAIVIDVDKVGSSCGYSIPIFAYAGERELLDRWSQTLEAADLEQFKSHSSSAFVDTSKAVLSMEDGFIAASESTGLRKYWSKHAKSIDGLPSLESCLKLPFIPESALNRRVAPLPGQSKKTVDEILIEAEEAEFAKKILPAVSMDMKLKPVEPLQITHDNGRDAKNIITGFVVGLITAAALDRLVAFLHV